MPGLLEGDDLSFVALFFDLVLGDLWFLGVRGDCEARVDAFLEVFFLGVRGESEARVDGSVLSRSPRFLLRDFFFFGDALLFDDDSAFFFFIVVLGVEGGES